MAYICVVDYEREMTANKYCKYGKYGFLSVDGTCYYLKKKTQKPVSDDLSRNRRHKYSVW